MRIGFIVEGDSEMEFVRALAARIIPPESASFHFVRLGGRAALSSAYTSALVLLSKGYSHIVVVFDADSTEPEVIAERRSRVDDALRLHRLLDVVTVCPAVPEIEAWVLAGIPSFGGSGMPPKAELERVTREAGLCGPTAVAQLIERAFDPHLAEQRNASFGEFATALRSLVDRPSAAIA